MSWDFINVTSEFALPSVRDVVAGQYLTIVRTDAEEIYYFGTYNGAAHWRATKLEDNLYPRDLMAKSVDGQSSYGAVSLGCDNSELAVRVNVSISFIIALLWQKNPLIVRQDNNDILFFMLWYP